MKLRAPSENKIYTEKVWNVNDKTQEFEYLIILNDLFELIESKIEKLKENIYEILEIKKNPKKYKRTLKRSKQ